MVENRNIIHIAWFILFFIIFLFFILLSLWLCVPFYVNSEVVPLLPEKTGFDECTFEVRSIGLTRADGAGLRIGDGRNTAVSVNTLRIDYSLRQLYQQRHIKQIALIGVELSCRIERGKFVIRGLDPKKFRPRSESASEPESGPGFSVGKIQIHDAVIICDWQAKRFRLPVEIGIIPQDRDWERLDYEIRIFPRGQEMRFAGVANLKQKQVHLKFEAKSLFPDRFADFVKTVPGLMLSGETDIKGDASIQTDPFEILSVEVSCEFRNQGTAYHGVILEANSLSRVEITGRRLSGKTGTLNIFLSRLPLRSPVSLSLSDVRCDVGITPDGINSSGDFKLNVDISEKGESPQIKITEAFQTDGNFFAELTQPGDWKFGITILDKAVLSRKRCGFMADSINIVSDIPKLDVYGSGKQGSGLVGYNVIFSNTKVSAESVIADLRFISLKGRARVGEELNLDGILTVQDAGVSASGLKIRGIQGVIPLIWPCQKKGPKGNISVSSVVLDDTDIGDISGVIRQTVSGAAFRAKHRNRIVPGLVLDIRGNEKRLHFAAHHNITSDINLGEFAPAANGVRLRGSLALDGEICFGNPGTSGSLNAALSRGILIYEEKDILVEGIELGFSMPELPSFRSGVGQELCFEKAMFGGITLTDGKIAFQLESDGSLFIEKSNLRWCRGNVGFQALRISPESDELNILLYCDRLNLAMILAQLGVGHAEGEGNVNGRIPVRIRDGKISFDDAFLFSTPGEGGTIHVTGAERLTTGIPKNTPHYSQIDLAREALKDFDYKWAKLTLRTEGEDLKAQLRFDGKPARPLPFLYKKEAGGFIRADAGSKGSHFQGIRLDVNMTLPLNEVIKYKDVFGGGE